MKKVALFLSLVLLFSCLIPLGAHAEEQPKTLLEVLAEQSADEREIFDDTSAYMDGMSAEWLDDEPLVTVYGFAFWYNPYVVTFEEKVEYAESSDMWPNSIIKECFSFGETIKLIEKTLPKVEGRTQGVFCAAEYGRSGDANIPRYLADIKNGSAKQLFCGIESNILDVVCFGIPREDHTEPVVYYITDQGTFARIYENSSKNSEMMEFSESEFSELLTRYKEYLDAALDEDGVQIYKNDNFWRLMKYDKWDAPRTPMDLPTEPNIFQKYLALWIAIPCVLVLAGGVTAFFLVRKKKKPAEQ